MCLEYMTTEVNIQVEVICLVTLCSTAVCYRIFGGSCCLHLYPKVPECGGSKVLRNVGFLPQHYTTLQNRRHRFKFLSPRKPQTSHQTLIGCLILCTGSMEILVGLKV